MLGDPRAIAHSIHEQQLELLRKRLLEELRLEADRNDNVLRTRLFGAGTPLADIERMTPQGMFVALVNRLRFSARPFESIEWLDAVKDDGGMVHAVGRLRPSKGQGDVRVPVLVSLVPWGEDWKAALPFELQAQLDDLKSGRTRAPGVTIAPAPASQHRRPRAASLRRRLRSHRVHRGKSSTCSTKRRRTCAPVAARISTRRT